MITPITTLKSPQNTRVWSIDWHPTLPLLASVGQDRNITFYSKTHSQSNPIWQKSQSISTQHLKTIRCVKFSNKGDKIAVCSFDSLISIYILNQGQYQFLTQLQGHQNQVKCISWHQSDLKLASCSRDKNIWIWGFNPTTYEYQCQNILQGHQNDIKSILWIDYTTLASCSYDNTIRIWTQNDDDYQQIQIIKNHQSIVWALEYNNGYLISTGSDMIIGVYKRNEQNGKFQTIKRIENVHDQPIYTCLIQYPFILTGAGDNMIKMCNLQGNFELDSQKQDKQKYQILQKIYHNNDVNCIKWKKQQINKDINKFLMASCSDDGQIKIWNIEFK